jgi:hypothetical protein
VTVEPRGLPIPEFDAERLLRVLDRHAVEYVIVGALAAVIHGAPVMTQDLDVMPEPSRRNGERLAGALAELRAVPFDDPERIDPRTGHVPEAPDFAYTADALARHGGRCSASPCPSPRWKTSSRASVGRTGRRTGRRCPRWKRR